jgi:hypothetical protein
MSKEYQAEMQCSQFEALLAEALDGTLAPDLEAGFTAHGEGCPACGPMLTEAQEGMLLLRSLPDVEPPKNLLHNILAATSHAEKPLAQAAPQGEPAKVGWMDRLRAWSPALSGMMHSRFVTSFCMAFFSLSLTLTLMGVRISDLAKIDWHPTALRKSVVLQYTHVEAKVQRYYDNMRLVVELESRVRGLKRAATPVEEPTNNKGDQNRKQNQNSEPDRNGRPRDYSQERDDASPQVATRELPGDVLAILFNGSEGATL